LVDLWRRETLLARTSVSIFLDIGIPAAAQDSGEAQEAGKVGPPLETREGVRRRFP
jgi:hypothetical protein